MDQGVWQATVHGVARVGQDLATKERERMKQCDVLSKWSIQFSSIKWLRTEWVI